jgi:hypothetical protein
MLVINEGDVRQGMDAIGLDGVALGTIETVWVGDPPEMNPHTLADGMPATGGRDGHFYVRNEGDDLYIPFDAIAILFPGQNVTVSCTAGECRERYGKRPSGLAQLKEVETAASR